MNESSELCEKLNQEIKKIENCYNNYKIEFEIGNEVLYITNFGEVVRATISNIQDFSRGGTIQGGMIYYWIIPENAKFTILNWIKLYTWLLCSTFFPCQNWQFPLPKGYPGHAVLAGYEFFRTEREATLILLLNELHEILKEKQQECTNS